jgi:hypothetical protein
VIPVSATDGNDQMAGWSSYGDYVALSAPGVAILHHHGRRRLCAGEWHVIFQPRSCAATVALMMSANPGLSNTKIESLLYSTATDLGAAGRDMYYGYGRGECGSCGAGGPGWHDAGRYPGTHRVHIGTVRPARP